MSFTSDKFNKVSAIPENTIHSFLSACDSVSISSEWLMISYEMPSVYVGRVQIILSLMFSCLLIEFW
jgi:hypothetical protein